MALGVLNPANRSRAKTTHSSFVTLLSGFKATIALGISPHFASGMAITAHSNLACVF